MGQAADPAYNRQETAAPHKSPVKNTRGKKPPLTVDPEMQSFPQDLPIPPLPRRTQRKRAKNGTPILDEDGLILKDDSYEPIPEKVTSEDEELLAEDPLEMLEDPSLAVELSEDPVRLYLKEIGQIHLLDADSEFRLATRIEAERRVRNLKKTPRCAAGRKSGTRPALQYLR